MRALSDQEKRTARIGALILLVYLSLFYGVRGFTYLEKERAEHQKLWQTARQLQREILLYERQSAEVRQLKSEFQIDPSMLSRATLVAEASAAIQRLAEGCGIQLGPVRESSARPAAKELTSMQLEAVGPVEAMMGFVLRLETLGYPLLVDTLQLTPESAKPGQLKLSLTLVLLDPDQWKPEVRRA
jgi:hypothetical protein